MTSHTAPSAAFASVPLPVPTSPGPATLALFVDLDGTLLDFAAHPGEVVVEPSLPAVLRALHTLLDGALAPLSGRPLRQIDDLLGWTGAAAGSHGAELRRADGSLIAPPRRRDRLAALHARAIALLTGMPGTFAEAKPDALALHYRNAPNAAAAVQAVAETLQREAGAGYALQPGNHVVELKRADVDKGRAVVALMREPPFAGRVPWVLGDDLTDEHAFARANALGGDSVIVGPRRPTCARHALADPRAVRAWLAALARSTPHPPA